MSLRDRIGDVLRLPSLSGGRVRERKATQTNREISDQQTKPARDREAERRLGRLEKVAGTGPLNDATLEPVSAPEQTHRLAHEPNEEGPSVEELAFFGTDIEPAGAEETGQDGLDVEDPFGVTGGDR